MLTLFTLTIFMIWLIVFICLIGTIRTYRLVLRHDADAGWLTDVCMRRTMTEQSSDGTVWTLVPT